MDKFSTCSLTRDSLYDQVADQIQAMIMARSLRPGDKLPGERELAEGLGVSRTVLREALRVLAVRGLVKVKPGCGTYVQELSVRDAIAPMELFLKLQRAPDSYANLNEVRRTIEVQVAGLAAQRATEHDIARLEDAIERMEQHKDDPKAFSQADLAFHLSLAAATHNDLFPMLLCPIARLLLEAILLSSYGPRATEAGLAHHCEVLEAVRAHDPEKARLAMQQHLCEAEALLRGAQQGLKGAMKDSKTALAPSDA